MMKQVVFKYALIVALSIAMAGTLFTVSSSTGKAHAATSRVTNPASSCPGNTYSRGKIWYSGGADSTTSCSGNTLILTFQSFDGNFVLYCQGHSALWATGTNSTSIQSFPPADVTFQSDGNLVVYDYSVALGVNQALWASGTNGKGATRLVLQGDANLVIYNGNNQALWASNTSGKC